MKPLYSQSEFEIAKSEEKLPLICYYCNMTYLCMKKYITREIKIKKGECKFCSLVCRGLSSQTKIKFNCKNCNKEFFKKNSEYIKSKNHFCTQSCSTSYNNKHKTHGYRRSRLEKWLGEQLIILYPNLKIDFNQKNIIGSELDIYIPSLNLAFELNGIFHYEPIYGNNTLEKVQKNDISKTKACHDAKIDLCIIDTSAQSYVKPSTSQKYLDIIVGVINERTG